MDCGLFQGQKEWRERNWKELPIPALEIDAVILTHAHLDHCGWIPRLVKEGFTRADLCDFRRRLTCAALSCPTPATCRKKTPPSTTRSRNRNIRRRCRSTPSTKREDCLKYFQVAHLGETKQLSPELSFRFVPAAHILGSCMAEITLTTQGQTRRLLFTGDIGRVRDTQVAPGKVVHSGPQEGETRRRNGDGVDLRQPRASAHRSAA